MRNPHATTCACVVLSWLGLVSTALGQAASQPASRPTTRLSAKEVAALVKDLGHRQWNVRERATESLAEGGPALLDQLQTAYKSHASPEIRLRIKRVVQQIVLSTELIENAGGFLGVRQQFITRADDLRIPEDHAGIRVIEVLPNTAAAAAGLTAGDIILAVDGQELSSRDNPDVFQRHISALKPGTKVRLTVMRDVIKLEFAATLGARPAAHADERSVEYQRAQKRFAELWRNRFDPNDKNVLQDQSDPLERGRVLENLIPRE
jgi:C-terminal processing protease CtpA/Prc